LIPHVTPPSESGGTHRITNDSTDSTTFQTGSKYIGKPPEGRQFKDRIMGYRCFGPYEVPAKQKSDKDVYCGDEAPETSRENEMKIRALLILFMSAACTPETLWAEALNTVNACVLYVRHTHAPLHIWIKNVVRLESQGLSS